MNSRGAKGRRHAAAACSFGIAAMALWSGSGMVRADNPVTMAPPIPVSSVPGDTPDNASQDTVFDWHEVPQDQKVTIVRAVFDQGGYQLFDDVGETIIVPFTNHNLYVMKFARSDNSRMYFLNKGDEPILYVPKNGYLENVSTNGGKWYPFPVDTTPPAQPVFLGIAPSWSDYVNMGWYPDMEYYGGYYCHEPFAPGVQLVPTYGLFVTIGSNNFYGWTDYHYYCADHPTPYHVFIHEDAAPHWDGNSDWHSGSFSDHWDGNHGGDHRSFHGDHRFHGDHNAQGDRSFSGVPVFGGSRPNFGPDRSSGSTRIFQGGRQNDTGRTWDNGGRDNSGRFSAPPAPPQNDSSQQSFDNTPRTFSAPTFSNNAGFGGDSGSARSFGGGGDNGGGNSGGGDRNSGGGNNDRGGGGGGGGFTASHRR